MPPKYKPIEERFWSKVVKQPEDHCWLWNGAKDSYGYGRISAQLPSGKWIAYPAHRISYEIAYGSFDKSLYVCHHCDNPECTKPEHLFLGTQHDNMADAKQKGRCRENGANHRMKTHCVRGHEYTEENTYKPPGKNERWCRECQRMHVRNFRRSKRNNSHESL